MSFCVNVIGFLVISIDILFFVSSSICSSVSHPISLSVHRIPILFFTLDYFLKFNAEHADGDGRITALAKDCGFNDAFEMADEITAMKKRMGMRCTLSEIGC